MQSRLLLNILKHKVCWESQLSISSSWDSIMPDVINLTVPEQLSVHNDDEHCNHLHQGSYSFISLWFLFNNRVTQYLLDKTVGAWRKKNPLNVGVDNLI